MMGQNDALSLPRLTIIAWETTHKQCATGSNFEAPGKRHCLLQPNGWPRFWPAVNFTEAKLPRKTIVTQIVLLFSKLQAFIVKGLVQTGLFPCNPPITPQIYANGKFFLYFSTLEINKRKEYIYMHFLNLFPRWSFFKKKKKKIFELEIIQLGHLYSKNKVFSNMNTNFLDDEDDCNWYGNTGGGHHDERTRGSHNISIREGHK